MNKYGIDIYRGRDLRTRYSAETILTKTLELFPTVRSAADVGCGVGTWLAVLRDQGITTVHGYEGPWLQRNQLVIPDDCFTALDLGHPDKLLRGSRYDLAICLEVAEHLASRA